MIFFRKKKQFDYKIFLQDGMVFQYQLRYYYIDCYTNFKLFKKEITIFSKSLKEVENKSSENIRKSLNPYSTIGDKEKNEIITYLSTELRGCNFHVNVNEQ